MKCNVGCTDRVVRILLGLVILGVGYHFRSWWGLIGVLPLLTGLCRFCPAYLPFGLNTSCEAKPPAEPPPAEKPPTA